MALTAVTLTERRKRPRKLTLQERAVRKAKLILKTAAAGKKKYQKSDEYLQDLLELITKPCTTCHGRGYTSSLDTITVDGATLVVADNFEESNRAFRAHGVSRFELKELKPVRSRKSED
jgi:hypothetical protein